VRLRVIEPVDDTLYCVDIRSCHNDARMSPVHHSTSAVLDSIRQVLWHVVATFVERAVVGSGTT